MNSAQRIAAALLEDEGAWDFTTKIIHTRNVSVSGTEPGWFLQGVDCEIDWHLDMDVRSWGLKEATPIIKAVRLRLEFEVDNETDRPDYQTVELAYPSAEQPQPGTDPKAMAMRYGAHVSAEAQWAHREESGVMVVPTEVEVDLRTSQIVVFF